MNKPVYASKINWVGVLTALAGAAAFADALPAEFAKWVLLVSGLASVVLRTLFTEVKS
jgi:hypothetical protein